MSGIKNSVAAQLLTEEKCAISSHCYGHALKLAVGYTMKQSTVCSEALESAYEITKLIKYTPKRNAQFNKLLLNKKTMRGVLGYGGYVNFVQHDGVYEVNP